MSNGGVTPELTNFLEMEKQKAVFTELISLITDKCFDRCISRPGARLDSSEQACLSSCALRFLETNQVVMQRLGSGGATQRR